MLPTYMKTEKFVISFLAVIIGILFAGVAFYLYQSTKVVGPAQTKTIGSLSPTPAPQSTLYLAIDVPDDEKVVDTKTITLNGKTTADAIIIVTTDNGDQVFTPAANGNFSTTATLVNGANVIIVTAVAPNGEETSVTRTITYSTETF